MANFKQRRLDCSITPLYVPATASALAMVLAITMPAHAQESASGRLKEPLEEVVVTGIRASVESAQEIKRNAEQIVDSVTAQDIGALPDRSVSEALQRIPGITLQRTSENRDAARLAAEGGGIFVRGLSWVRSEANGRDIFSANNGRGLSFEDMSADLLAGVDVYKNPSAEMIEGGVGGTVNLRTRLPFDTTRRLLAFSGDYNYADLTKQGFFSGNALYSDQWDAGEGKIGGLLSVSIGNIGNRTDSVQTGRYEPRTNAAGGTVYIPAAFGWRTIEWEQKRTAVTAALQWQPVDALQFTLQGLYTQANPKDIEHALGDTQGAYTPDDPSYVFDDRGVLVAGTLPNYQATADTRFTESNKRTGDYSLNMKYSINDRWTVSGDVQYVRSHADTLTMTAFTQLGGAAPGTLDFDLRGDTPYMNANQGSQADQSAYWWAAAMDHLEDNDAHAWAERIDVDFAFDENPWLESFRFGVRGTERKSLTRQTGYNWAILSQQFWGGNGPPVMLNQTGYGANQNANLPASAELYQFNNFFRGDVNTPGVAWFPTGSLVGWGTRRAHNILQSSQSAGSGWTPLTANDFETSMPRGDNISGGVNDQSEDTRAVYAMLRFSHGSPIGPMDGNIGVRLVETENESVGLETFLTQLQDNRTAANCQALAVNTDANAANDVSCAPIAIAEAFVQPGRLAASDTGLNYTDVLPSLNLKFSLTEDLQLRFAAGRAMVRPTFSQLVGFTTLNFNFLAAGATNPEQAYLPNPNGFMTGSGGNPTLKPTRSNQFDTSLEWYFSPTGSIAGALFYKDITNYIFSGVTEETYTANGQTQTFAVTRNANGPKGKIQGFELAYTQFYDALPGIFSGLGLQTNFTYVDSSGGSNAAVNVIEAPQVEGSNDRTLPLEGMSKTSYNITALYEKYDISARIAYNWRERYLLTTSASNINRPVWSDDYGQVDASVFYSITPRVKVGLQGTNLLNTRTYLDVGGASLAPRYSWTDTDRRIAIAMRSQF